MASLAYLSMVKGNVCFDASLFDDIQNLIT